MSTLTLQWPKRKGTNKQTMIYQTTTQKTKKKLSNTNPLKSRGESSAPER